MKEKLILFLIIFYVILFVVALTGCTPIEVNRKVDVPITIPCKVKVPVLTPLASDSVPMIPDREWRKMTPKEKKAYAKILLRALGRDQIMLKGELKALQTAIQGCG